MHVFKYSPREGTPASKMQNQIDGKTKEENLQANFARYYSDLAYQALVEFLLTNAKEVEGEPAKAAKAAAKGK